MPLIRRAANALTLEADFPGLQIKKLVGTTGATEGTNVDVAHGVGDVDKMISWTARVKFDDNTWVSQGVRNDPINQEFIAFPISDTNFRLGLKAGNSAGILSKEFEILLFYFL